MMSAIGLASNPKLAQDKVLPKVEQIKIQVKVPRVIIILIAN